MRTSRLTLLVFTVFLAACDDGSSSAPAVSGLPAQVPVIAYVPSLATHQVSLIDTQLNRVVARVPMGFNPVVLAITPDGRKLFSANFETDYLTVLDTRTL
jgi:DNA-binding beta-propeller fold protein YncE